MRRRLKCVKKVSGKEREKKWVREVSKQDIEKRRRRKKKWSGGGGEGVATDSCGVAQIRMAFTS